MERDPKARPIASQVFIVLKSPFLGHDSTHFFEVKGCVRIRALAPPTRLLGVLCVGDVLYVVDARHDSNLEGMFCKQKCVPCPLKELEHASVDIDATQSRVEVPCFDGLALSLSPRGRMFSAVHLHPLLY